MIVILHGLPGQDGKDTAYETGVAYHLNTLNVRIVEFTPPKVVPYVRNGADLCEFKNVERDIEFNFTHHDASGAHYSVSPNVRGQPPLLAVGCTAGLGAPWPMR